MFTSRRALKRRAISALEGNWGKAVGVTASFLGIAIGMALIGSIILSVVSYSGNASYLMHSYARLSASGFISELILEFGISLIAAPLTLGMIRFYLKLSRYKKAVAAGEAPDEEQKAQVSDLFSGFKFFWKSVGLFWMTALFVFLWMLLLIVPGIIAVYRYSMAFYIMADNPEKGVLEAITNSKNMMVDHKAELFVLEFSFYLWMLLAVLTLGIGLLWLTPYVYTTYVEYYEYLRKLPQEQETAAPVKAEPGLV